MRWLSPTVRATYCTRVARVRIHALVSWYDEQADHLAELVASVAPLVDSVVAVDGRYDLLPSVYHRSPADQYDALDAACDQHGLALTIHAPAQPWQGNEVEKRARMFAIANGVATPYEDWFLIMDGDMLMCQRGDPEKARKMLAEAPEGYDAAGVTFGELAYGATLDGYNHLTSTTAPFRSMFRALPGLTVEWAHYFYNVVQPDGSRRYLWYEPLDDKRGNYTPHSSIAVVNLINEVRLLHRPWVRERDRVVAKQTYHEEAASRVIERVPPVKP